VAGWKTGGWILVTLRRTAVTWINNRIVAAKTRMTGGFRPAQGTSDTTTGLLDRQRPCRVMSCTLSPNSGPFAVISMQLLLSL